MVWERQEVGKRADVRVDSLGGGRARGCELATRRGRLQSGSMDDVC